MNEIPTARLTLGWQLTFFLLVVAFLLSADYAAAEPPVVKEESVSEVSETSAVLHARLNTADTPEGAYWQFQLVEDPAEYRSEVSCPEDDPEPPDWQCFGSDLYGGPGPESHERQPGDLPTEMLWIAEEDQDVSIDLSAIGRVLEPNTTYHYRVVAVERVEAIDTTQWLYPPVYGPDQTFFTGTEAEPPPDEPGDEDPVADLPPPPSPEIEEPPLQPRHNRCQRQQKKQVRQKKSLRRVHLQCNRVSVDRRTRR